MVSMPSYRICFINEIPRNQQLFRCCQRSIEIRVARTPERAIEAAKKRFARLEGIRDWKLHAAFIEVEAIEAIDIEPRPERRAEISAGSSGREHVGRQRASGLAGNTARQTTSRPRLDNKPGGLRSEELSPEQRAELARRAEAASSRGKPPSI
jgi:hypothetical protein